jgi:hypothetical protein
MYAENHRKLVAITNRQYAVPQRQNAVLHATVGLIKFVGIEAFELLNYDNDDLDIQAQISLFPNVGLTAKNGSQLLNTYRQASEANIACNIFAESMLGASADDQIRQTREATLETLKPMAVVLFGDADALHPLTKKFSVLKD